MISDNQNQLMNNSNSNQNTIRMIVVDDRKLIRETLQIYLETESDINIIGYADSATTGLEQIKNLDPDIAILDLEMPDMNGLAAIEIIRQRFPTTKVLVLSGHEEPEYINQAIKAGAKGYLLKGTTPQDLADAIRYVNRGCFHLGPGLLEKLTLSSLDKSITESKSDLEDKLRKSRQQLKWELTDECKTLIDRGTETTHRQLTHMLEMQLYNLKNKQSETIVKYKRLQNKVVLLLISQVVLLLIMVGYMIIDRVL